MCPNGGWPRSWPRPIASARSSLRRAPARRCARSGHLERVRQARPVVVALGRDEHLRLVLEPPERLAVDDPVAVALERRPQTAVLLGPARCGRVGARRQRREVALLVRRANALAVRGRCRRRVIRATDRAATAPQPQVGVVLERLADRALGLAQRPARTRRAPGPAGAPSAAVMNSCVSSPSGNEPASQALQTTPPAAARSRRGARRSPHDAQAPSAGARPAATSSLSRNASALACVALRRRRPRAARARWRAGCRRPDAARRSRTAATTASQARAARVERAPRARAGARGRRASRRR